MPFDAVVLFAKVPRAGRVKTRLGAVLGQRQAARLYGLFLKYLSWRLRRLPGGLRLFLAVDPPSGSKSILRYFPYPGKPVVLAQKGRDLGERMLNASREAQKQGAGKVLVIGSDCLELGRKQLTGARRLLDRKDLVLGRARDGGYYLLGWERPSGACLKGVPWSTRAVLRKTADNARKAGLRVGFLPLLSDVDEAKDLEGLGRKLDPHNPVTPALKRQL